MAEKSLVAELTETANKKQRYNKLWVVKYRMGPILSTQVIIAEDKEDACRAGHRYINLLKLKSDNRKYMIIGDPQPFAIDVDEEIEKFHRDENSLRQEIR